ncbi:MAG: ROK family protein [Chthoniobacterales bacterium]|nr:ROK family protein [Chthoniobacterales bacterium]
MKKILAVDIGGTHVKLMVSRTERRKFASGLKLTPKQLTSEIKEVAGDWEFDAVSLGFPSVIAKGQIMKDPKNLAPGWVGWDFQKSLGKPTRVINDAAMQALGSFRGRRMLFLGLGTGLGSTLLWDHNVLPLELGDLPYPGVERIELVLGKAGLARLGRKTWQREVLAVVAQLKLALVADYVVLGGGNAKQLEKLPDGTELGHNRNAFLGGCRLWQIDARTRRSKWNIIS